MRLQSFSFLCFCSLVVTSNSLDEPPVPCNDDWIHSSQTDALRDIFLATGMDASMHFSWFNNSSAATDGYCQFSGVSCDNKGYVIDLDLRAGGLTGTLPESIGQLMNLRRLNVNSNHLSGDLPYSLGSLRNLMYINLGRNSFRGAFPTISDNRVLRRLSIDRNAFSGTVPASLCRSSALIYLDLSGNTKLVGSLPTCLGSLTALSTLRITDIGLTGTVPVGLCGERDMNGFKPNKYGCDAVGCPAGYYQRGLGRRSDNTTTCEICTVPSNVIGATRCQWAVSSTIKDPVKPVLWSPSSVPSSFIYSTPSSSYPSSVPSAIPTTAPIPSRTPSLTPSISPTSYVPISNPPQASPANNVSTIIGIDSIEGEDSSKGGIIGGTVMACAFVIVAALLVWRRQSNFQKLTEASSLNVSLSDPVEAEDIPSLPLKSLSTIEEESSLVVAPSGSTEYSIIKTPDSIPQSSESIIYTETYFTRKVRFTLPEPIPWSSDDSDESGSDADDAKTKEPASNDGVGAGTWASWILNPMCEPSSLCSTPIGPSSQQVWAAEDDADSVPSRASSTAPILNRNEITSSDDACFELVVPSRQVELTSGTTPTSSSQIPRLGIQDRVELESDGILIVERPGTSSRQNTTSIPAPLVLSRNALRQQTSLTSPPAQAMVYRLKGGKLPTAVEGHGMAEI